MLIAAREILVLITLSQLIQWVTLQSSFISVPPHQLCLSISAKILFHHDATAMVEVVRKDYCLALWSVSS